MRLSRPKALIIFHQDWQMEFELIHRFLNLVFTSNPWRNKSSKRPHFEAQSTIYLKT